MAQVIIVSNRLPVSVKRVDGQLEFYPSVGGLATGLSSYARQRRNRWVGWPGLPSEDLSESDKEAITKELAKHNCFPVFLTKRQLEDYYNGYSNGVLWPLFHNLPLKAKAMDKHWKAYREVNRLFAETVLGLSQPKSTIWIHDYQLLLMPEMLRVERPKDNIGLFLHIPFPEPTTLRQIPEAKRLLKGMLGADLAGFHTAAYADNFLACCQDQNIGVTATKQVILPERTVRVTDFPMGIDYDKFAQASKSRAVKKALKQYKKHFRGKRVILTVDRLDPTKGLVERVRAYQEFLRQNPKIHGKVVMAMVAVPSRTEIKEYQALTKRLERLINDINVTYGTAKWQPIDYMYTSLPFEELAALYQVADVAFIAPIKDGMNLVAKEYLASKPNKNGVLILSETAGAAHELTEALIVNPNHRDSLVTALDTALKMPKRELKRRTAAMQQQIAGSTVHHWASTFMKSLEAPAAGSVRITHTLRRYLRRELIDHYRASHRRLLLLDYDGVLSPFFNDPRKARPEKALLNLLTKLANDPDNELVLVSGRSKQDLTPWFADVPIAIAAEHGAFVREAGSKHWRSTLASGLEWKKEVQAILEDYSRQTPRSFVEVKESSLVWHYRQSPVYTSQKNLVILKRLLKPVARRYGLSVKTGNKILEIKPEEIDKGTAIMHWLQPEHDFVLAFGDDYTDEDMFNLLPITAHTIKVGRGRTNAQFRISSVTDALDLLRRFAR